RLRLQEIQPLPLVLSEPRPRHQERLHPQEIQPLPLVLSESRQVLPRRQQDSSSLHQPEHLRHHLASHHLAWHHLAWHHLAWLLRRPEHRRPPERHSLELDWPQVPVLPMSNRRFPFPSATIILLRWRNDERSGLGATNRSDE
ncbi:MAG: hypothetical protein FD138_121, partial [Planctomycetota bacterium]